MRSERVIIIHGDTSQCLSFAKALANITSTNVGVSPFAPEPIPFKITSHNDLLIENALLKNYAVKPSKYIDKPKNNYRKR